MCKISYAGEHFSDIKVIPAQKYWLSNVNVLGVNLPHLRSTDYPIG